MVYHRETAARSYLEAAGYFGRRDLDNAVPFRFIELERRIVGGRLQYDMGTGFFGRDQRLVSGIDIQHQAAGNLLNETYNANVRINAAGGRYFEPAPRKEHFSAASGSITDYDTKTIDGQTQHCSFACRPFGTLMQGWDLGPVVETTG